MEEKEPSEIAIDIDEHQHTALSDTVLLLGDIREASQESRQHVEVLREGTAHCILAWFVEGWSGGDITYGPGSSHGAQRAFLLPSATHVKKGCVLAVETKRAADGILSVTVCNE